MPLTDAHRRQIAQFILIADSYISLANNAAGLTGETFGMTKLEFMPPASLSARARDLCLLSAHLSSAAIRLASIDEVLKWANEGRATYKECREYFSIGARSTGVDSRGESCSEWLHVMLRDNAAHEEPVAGDSSTIARARWNARQRLVERLTFSEVYAQLKVISAQLRAHLGSTFAMSLPTL